MSHVLNWNGKDLPSELRKLRPGRYVVEEVGEAPVLTPDEEEGIRAGLASIDAGRAIPAEQVHADLLRRRRP